MMVNNRGTGVIGMAVFLAALSGLTVVTLKMSQNNSQFTQRQTLKTEVQGATNLLMAKLTTSPNINQVFGANAFDPDCANGGVAEQADNNTAGDGDFALQGIGVAGGGIVNSPNNAQGESATIDTCRRNLDLSSLDAQFEGLEVVKVEYNRAAGSFTQDDRTTYSVPLKFEFSDDNGRKASALRYALFEESGGAYNLSVGSPSSSTDDNAMLSRYQDVLTDISTLQATKIALTDEVNSVIDNYNTNEFRDSLLSTVAGLLPGSSVATAIASYLGTTSTLAEAETALTNLLNDVVTSDQDDGDTDGDGGSVASIGCGGLGSIGGPAPGGPIVVTDPDVGGGGPLAGGGTPGPSLTNDPGCSPSDGGPGGKI